MASISAPTPPPRNLIFQSSHRHPKRRRSSLSPSPPFPSSSRFSDSHLCRCTNSSSSSSSDNQGWRWDAVIQDVFKSAIKTFDSYFGKRPWDGLDNGDFVETASRERGDEQRGAQEWDWDRWKKHFEDIDDQERLVSVLKSQLRSAVNSEDYEDASRIKVAIAAATTNDTVGEVMRNLLKAVAEERYQEAAFLRDHAGAGLVGWWSGISDEVCDPHGLIIRITAEHGRYVARSYSPRQLATATAGVPLFEIFLIMNKKGEYKQQAVYLKRKKQPQDPSMLSSIASSSLSRTGPTEEKDDLFVVTADETEDDDDTEDGFDPVDGFPGFNNIFRDMIPGVKVKVLKVTMPSKMDRDFIAKVIDDLEDEEDEDEEDEDEEDEEDEDEEDEEDEEEEDEDDEDESSEGEDDIKGESEEERDEIDVDAASEMIDNVGHGEISIKVMVGGLAQKSSPSLRGEDRVRVPAKLERKGRMSFCLSIEKETKRQDAGAKELASAEKQGKLQGQRSLDQVMLDLAKFIGKEKIPLKVLKDLSELLSVSLSQAQNRQPLSGSTTFHRIDASASPDPLSGLYIGARGLYTSEVIHLQRKVGQWQDNSGSNSKEASRLEFYEYVEAVKLTGDPYVPAGEVAFRAKVGKRYQLPHKGIIPEEFGVIARYKGQGRLADPGFGNPRWVDGELVILDGKYVKGGPIIGFVYWAPEYHFLVFFNRLRLP